MDMKEFEMDLKMSIQGWTVQATGPKDYFEEATLPVTDWLTKVTNEEDKIIRWAMFTNAVRLVTTEAILWEYHLRVEPHVGYDIVNDLTYFIFKIHNNGTVFTVSRGVLPLE